MDNNYNQQFMQNLKSQPVSQPLGEQNTSKTPIIIAIILAVILLFESIALVVMATNNSTLANELSAEETEETEVVDDDEEYSGYVFDDEGNMTAIDLECKNENGSNYALSTNNSYKYYNAESQSATSGTYTINRDSIIQLTDSDNGQKTIFYDGVIAVDDTIIYECEAISNEVEDGTE